MFCQFCGQELNENSSFCGHCGHKNEDAPAVVQQPRQTVKEQQAPVQTLREEPQAVRRGFMKKSKYLRTQAGEKTRLMNLVSILAMVVAVAILVSAALVGLGQDIGDVPVIKLAKMDEVYEEMSDAMDDVTDEDIERAAESFQERYDCTDAEADRMEKALKNLADKQSFWNLTNYILAEITMDSSILEDETGAVALIMFLALPAIALLAFVLAIVFALLGGLLRNTGWTGASVIVSAICVPMMSGVILTVLALAVLIAQLVLCKLVDNRYLHALSGETEE